MPFETPADRSATARHGSLSVEGNRVVDARGEPVAFAGTTFALGRGPSEFRRAYNAEMMHYLKSEWGTSLVRVTLPAEGIDAYQEDPEAGIIQVEEVVDAAIREGLYVVVGWDSRGEGIPQDEAIAFFEQLARNYGHQPNLIYEISHGREEMDWSSRLKPAAEAIIAGIRAADADNLIVVGSPHHSRHVDTASADPILMDRNIVYGLRFQAGVDGEDLRNRVRTALANEVPVLATNWTLADLNRAQPEVWEEAEAWLRFMRAFNISHIASAEGEMDEAVSILKPEAPERGPWTDDDLNEAGRYLRNLFRRWQAPEWEGAALSAAIQ